MFDVALAWIPGVEVVRTILGHASMNTTEIYAERDLEKAAMLIMSVG